MPKVRASEHSFISFKAKRPVTALRNSWLLSGLFSCGALWSSTFPQICSFIRGLWLSWNLAIGLYNVFRTLHSVAQWFDKIKTQMPIPPFNKKSLLGQRCCYGPSRAGLPAVSTITKWAMLTNDAFERLPQNHFNAHLKRRKKFWWCLQPLGLTGARRIIKFLLFTNIVIIDYTSSRALFHS